MVNVAATMLQNSTHNGQQVHTFRPGGYRSVPPQLFLPGKKVDCKRHSSANEACTIVAMGSEIEHLPGIPTADLSDNVYHVPFNSFQCCLGQEGPHAMRTT